MERIEFVGILTPLALALRANVDTATWAAYYRALNDVPMRWLSAAVDLALKQHREFFPKPGELRALADRALAAAQAELTPGPCDVCGNTRWVEAPDTKGVKRAARCGCYHAYQDAVRALGWVPAPVALVEAGELEPFDPRMAQLGEDR